MRKCLIAFCICILLPLSAFCETHIVEVRTQIGDNAVIYPQIEGESMEQINSEIVSKAGIIQHLVTLTTLGNSSWGLHVDYQVIYDQNDILSLLIRAEGKMPNGRYGKQVTAYTFDLRNGTIITMDDLFTDSETAIFQLTERAQNDLEEELSGGYMEHSQLDPLPVDNFTVSENGITFWYDADDFSWLDGCPGAYSVWPEELEDLADNIQNEWAERIKWKTSQPDGETILAAVEAGTCPRVDAKLDDPIIPVIEKGHCSGEPEIVPGGRAFMLEAPEWRGVWLLTDAISDELDDSVIEGIQIRRGGYMGLIIEYTTAETWRNLLGDPDETVQMTESMAYDYRLEPGFFDVYHYGTHQLRLYADDEERLICVQLSR